MYLQWRSNRIHLRSHVAIGIKLSVVDLKGNHLDIDVAFSSLFHTVTRLGTGSSSNTVYGLRSSLYAGYEGQHKLLAI